MTWGIERRFVLAERIDLYSLVGSLIGSMTGKKSKLSFVMPCRCLIGLFCILVVSRLLYGSRLSESSRWCLQHMVPTRSEPCVACFSQLPYGKPVGMGRGKRQTGDCSSRIYYGWGHGVLLFLLLGDVTWCMQHVVHVNKYLNYLL